MNKNNDIEIRTCIVTRKKEKKQNLIRLALNIHKNTYLFDEFQKIQSRAIYISKSYEALDKLSKQKKYNIESEELLKILNYLKKNVKEKKDEILAQTFKTMNNSEYLVFGIDDCVEKIKTNKIRVLILPANIKESYKNRFEKLCELNGVKIISIKKQTMLQKVFGTKVNVIGITNKRVAYGIIKKLEG